MRDINTVNLVGSIATVPEVVLAENGTKKIRFLITMRTDEPRTRIDVVPVTLWDDGDLDRSMLVDGDEMPVAVGDRAAVTARLQRHVWETQEGIQSRLEVVATRVELVERKIE